MLRQSVLWPLFLATAILSHTATAAEDDLPVLLVSYEGQRPVPLAADDPLQDSVGILFVSPEKYAERDPQSDGYATAFLISECYALAGTNPIGALPATQRMFGGSTVELVGVRFGLGLKPGAEPGALTPDSFRASWPVTVNHVVPTNVDDLMFGQTRWSLLHLDGCETGAKENGKPIPFDPVTSLELQESGLPATVRHVGALMTDTLSLVELPKCQILGQIRSLAWESTCSSWLGMMGGPVLTFDASRKAWSAIGFIPLGNLALLLTPTSSIASGKRTIDIYGVDEKSPRYFDFTTNIVPMSQVWPWVRDLAEVDNAGLIDAARAGVAEEETDLRQSLMMQMQQHPQSEWSALDYTRLALGLQSLGMEADAAKFLKAAVAKDPSYAPAAFRLSVMIEWLGPQGISDAELQIIRNTMGEAIAKYPEDPQLILRRIFVEQKLALHQDIIEDGDKYALADFRFPGSAAFFVDRGEAFLALGELDKAREAFVEAYKKDAMDPDAVRGLAKMKLFQGEIEDAVRLAEKAVKFETNDPSSNIILGLARARNGNVDGAIEAMSAACGQCGPSATPYIYLAIMRGYKRALSGDKSTDLLLTQEEIFGTYDNLWPRQMADVFAGARTLESLAGFDYSGYTPDWRRAIEIGRLVFAAAYDLSQGRTIDYPSIEQNMLKYRDMNFVHLAPILKDWAARVAAAQP